MTICYEWMTDSDLMLRVYWSTILLFSRHMDGDSNEKGQGDNFLTFTALRREEKNLPIVDMLGPIWTQMAGPQFVSIFDYRCIYGGDYLYCYGYYHYN